MPPPQNLNAQPPDLADLVDLAPVGVFISMVAGHFQYVNAAMAQMLGYETPEKLIAELTDIPNQLYMDPAERQNYLDALREHGQVTDHLFHFKRRDGSPIWLLTNARAIRNDSGEVVATHGFLVDQTERKRDQDALAASERRFRTLVDGMSDGVWQTDADYALTMCNSAFERMTGYTCAEFDNLNLYERHPAEDAGRMREAMRRRRMAGKLHAPHGDDVRRWEYGLKRKDGTLIQLEAMIASQYSDSGAFQGLIGVSRDVTQRLKEQKALQRTRETIDNYQDCVFWISPDGTFFDVNETACGRLGYSREEMLDGMGVWDIDPTYQAPHWQKEWRRLKAGGSVTLETVHRTRGGREYPVEITAHYQRYGESEFNCSFARDITERKAAREILQRTRSSLDQSDDCVFWIAPDGSLFDINETVCRRLGYSREELLDGMGVWDVDPLYDEARWLSLWERMKVHGSITFETLHRTRQGRDFPVEVTVHYQRFGELEFNCSFARDISARKAAEEALHATDQLLRSLFGNMLHSVIIYTPVEDATDFVIDDMNPAAEAVTKLARGDALGRRLSEAIPEAKDTGIFEALAEVARTGQPKTLPKLHVESEDRRGWYRNSLFSLPTGQVVAVFEDVTDLIETQRALAESEQRFQGLLQMALDPIYVHDMSATGQLSAFIEVNQAACKVLGYSQEELLQMSPLDIDDFQLSTQSNAHVVNELLEDGSALFRRVHIAKDGRRIPMELHAQRIGPPEAPMVMTIARDITERVRIEEELKLASREAQAASRAKSEFLATMSHEIRTPLHGLMGMLQLVENSKLDQEQREYIATALSSGRGLLGILNDVLDLSKIEAGLLELTSTRFVPRDLLREVEALYAHASRAKGLILEVDAPAKPELLGDPGRLRQVLFNLVGNAVKFTEQGRIQVSASAGEPSPSGKTLLTLTVKDTGAGIPEAFTKRMFDPFTQADATFSRRHPGTGLGLSIVKRLVGAMGGELMVDSRIGQGTRFTVRVPLTLAAGHLEKDNKDIADEATALPPNLRILLAEDERINRLLVEKMLALAGVTVVSVGNGLEAVEATKREHFDCVLLDLQMPVMDGLEAARQIRKHVSPAPPLIALTAHALKGDRQAVLDQGLDDYLAKPFEQKELLEVIARSCAP